MQVLELEAGEGRLMTTAWQDWPAAERDAASPMDLIFWGKFRDRHKVHRFRSCPPIELDYSGSIGWPAWEDIPSSYHSEIWVPPWADYLAIRLWMSIDGPNDYVGFYLSRARPALAGVYGSEIQVKLGCEIEWLVPGEEECGAAKCEDCDGHVETDQNVLYQKESVVTVTEDLRDQVVAFKWQIHRSYVATSTRIVNEGANRRPWTWRD